MKIGDINLQDVNIRTSEVDDSVCSFLAPDQSKYYVGCVATELVDKLKLNSGITACC